MLPQQVNPSHREDIATAPYNFVPLPDRPLLLVADHLPDQDVYDPARYTGSIACSLTTETPTFVRAPLPATTYRDYKPQEEKQLPYEERTKNKPAFFHTGDPQQPLIPGSTLRGLVRSLVEIIGHGRFESVTHRRLIFRAVGDTSSHGDRYRNQILVNDGQGSEGSQKYYAYTPRVRAGYLVQIGGEWRIYAAQQIRGTSFARISHRLLKPLEGRLAPMAGCKNAYTIYIEPGPWEHQRVRGGFIRMRYAKAQRAAARQEPGLTPGALVYSGSMFSKRSEAVVYPLDPDPDKSHRIDDELIAVYRDQISAEQANLLGDEGVLSAGMSKDQTLNEQDGLPAQRQPVFYLVEKVKNPKTNEPEERVSFFGHTMMMRLPYPYAVHNFVPPALQADPERKTVDLAQAIFGFVPLAEAERAQDRPGEERRKTANGYAGRVFFGDARLDGPQERLWLLDPGDPQGWLTPKILGTPKPTAFQLYLVQRTPDPLPRQGSGKVQKALADYASTPPGAAAQGETVLRGYKRYWHKRGPVTRATIEEPPEAEEPPKRADPRADEEPKRRKHDTQYTCMAPLAPGVRFTFSIRFENLAAWELGALLWALQPPVPEGVEVRHQVGMGKPLGMGSVRLQVEKLRLEDRRARYSRLFVEPEAGPRATPGEAAWETGARTPQPGETPSDLIAAFERYLLDQLGERRAQRLSDLPRIQALLALMAWPGPPDVETRYQGLQEFRSRPVLPAPAPVAATPGRAPTPAPAPTVFSTERAPSTSSTPAQPAIDAEETWRWMQERAAQTVLPPSDTRRGPATRLTSRHEAKEGMKVLGTAVRVTVDLRVEIDIGLAEIKGFLPDRQIVPPVRDRADLEARFPAGTPVEAWISRIDRRGVVILTLREPSP